MEESKTEQLNFTGAPYNMTEPVPNFYKYPENISYIYKEKDKRINKVAIKIMNAIDKISNDYDMVEVIEKILMEETKNEK